MNSKGLYCYPVGENTLRNSGKKINSNRKKCTADPDSWVFRHTHTHKITFTSSSYSTWPVCPGVSLFSNTLHFYVCTSISLHVIIIPLLFSQSSLVRIIVFLGILFPPLCQAGFPSGEASEEKEEEQLQCERNSDSDPRDPQEEGCAVFKTAGEEFHPPIPCLLLSIVYPYVVLRNTPFKGFVGCS